MSESTKLTGILLAELTISKKVSRWREWGMFANLLTLARIALTPLFVWWFLSSRWELNVLSFVAFVTAALTDWWDGHHARRHKTITNLGKFLDPLADKLLTIAAMITFVFEGLVMGWMVAVIFVRDFVLTWKRIRAAKRNEKFTTLGLAKLKTTVQLTAIIVIIALWTHHNVPEDYHLCGGCLSEAALVLLFNGLIGVTMILALVSGALYFIRRSPSTP